MHLCSVYTYNRCSINYCIIVAMILALLTSHLSCYFDAVFWMICIDEFTTLLQKHSCSAAFYYSFCFCFCNINGGMVNNFGNVIVSLLYKICSL